MDKLFLRIALNQEEHQLRLVLIVDSCIFDVMSKIVL